MSISRPILITLLLFLSVNIVHARDFEVKKSAGTYEITIKLERYPAVVGDNGIEIKITDGGTITDAEVWINYYMPPMPRMAPMNYKVKGILKNGKYRAPMSLIMAGPWIIAIKIMRGEKVVTTKINIDVR